MTWTRVLYSPQDFAGLVDFVYRFEDMYSSDMKNCDFFGWYSVDMFLVGCLD